MALTVAQLLTPITEDQATTTILDILTSLGFAGTSWQSGSMQLNMVKTLARLVSSFSETIATITQGGFNDEATGGWLTLLSKSHYDNDRIAADFTEGQVLLTSAPTAPSSYTIVASQLVVADSIHGYTYRNTTGGTLVPGGTLTLDFIAETAGIARDVTVGTITIMKTPLAGVTCLNPAITGSSTWITSNGADEESDESLRSRNRTKWATLAPNPPGEAYEYYTRQADPSVTRVYVDTDNPRGPGTLDVWIAGANGPLSPGTISDIEDYMDGTTDGIPRIGTLHDAQFASAIQYDQAVSGVIYILAAYNTTANQDVIKAAITAAFRAIPIGGVKTPDSLVGKIPIGSIYQAILPNTGVLNWVPTAPTADVPLPSNSVAVPSTTGLSFQSV
jgi:uncharacterized phage protein gp47/JayE